MEQEKMLIKNMGWIEVITGSMFSGKSEELIRRAKRVIFAKQSLMIFNHKSDKRYAEDSVVSHNKNTLNALAVSSAEDILLRVIETEDIEGIEIDVVCIDEAQFFGEKIVEVCETLANRGKRVIVAGLDQDFRGEPFKPMDTLMSKAEFVSKFNAVCVCCGNIASKTQRLVNGKPARYDDPIILVGASESYEARCRNCHIVIKK